ncbi:MAG: hypothetical protein ACE5PO_04610 [Candidatus Bathyarchaeia archaeon]
MRLQYQHRFMNIAEVKAKVVEVVKERFPDLKLKPSESYEIDSNNLVMSGHNLTVIFRFSKLVENISRAFTDIPVVDLTIEIQGNADESREFAVGFKNFFEQKLLRGGG